MKKVSYKYFCVINASIIIFFLLSYAKMNCQTSGPTVPEVSSFESVNMTSTVNEATGDFVYNIPLLEIPNAPGDGFPISINYHAGIPYDMQASWVGLGWNLSVGHITRYKSGYPDDYNGAIVTQALKTNKRYYHTLSIGLGPSNFNWAGTSFKGMTLQGINLSFPTPIGSASIGFVRRGGGWGIGSFSAGTGFSGAYPMTSGLGINNSPSKIFSSGYTIDVSIIGALGIHFGASYSNHAYWVDETQDLYAYGYLNTLNYWKRVARYQSQDSWVNWNDYRKKYKADYFESSVMDPAGNMYSNCLGTSEDSYSVETEGISGIFKPFRNNFVSYPLSNLSPKNQMLVDQLGVNVAQYYATDHGECEFRFLNDAGILHDDLEYISPRIQSVIAENVKSKLIIPRIERDGILTGFTIVRPDGIIYEFNEPVYGLEETNIGQSHDGNEFSKTVLKKPYAYAWYLTAIKSPDYIDRTNDGPSDDDWGEWIQFEYKAPDAGSLNYPWRVPATGIREADVLNDENTGFSSQYVKSYGKKEIKMLCSAKTRTHVAVFSTKQRNDGLGIDSDGNIMQDYKLYKLDEIGIYSKKDWIDSDNDGAVSKSEVKNPINRITFDYGYSLAQGSPNSDGNGNKILGEINGDGRLTLNSINYWLGTTQKMPSYNFCYYDSYKYNGNNCWDTWGYYFSNGSFGNHIRNNNGEAKAWSLKSITFPTGAIEEINYEDKEYNSISNNPLNQLKTGCGIRVKNIKFTDGLKQYYLNYSYANGVATQVPAPYGASDKDERPDNNVSGLKKDYQLYGAASPQIYYKSVQIAKGTSELDKSGGITEYINITPDEYPQNIKREYFVNDIDRPVICERKNYNAFYGLPKKITQYSVPNVMISEKIFNYSIDPQKVWSKDANGYNLHYKSIGFIRQILMVALSFGGNPYGSWGILNYYQPQTISIQENQDGVTKTTNNLEFDFKTGNTVKAKTTNSEGVDIYTITEPAYWKYPGMEAKNMLTQTGMKKEYYGGLLNNNLINAEVKLWKDWGTIAGSTEQYTGVWRQSMNYIWIGDKGNFVDISGTTRDENDNFIFNSGKKIWQRTSNITSYDKHGHSLEEKSINGDYTSSIFSFDETLPVAIIKNARKGECGYLSFESDFENKSDYNRWDNNGNFQLLSVNSVGIKPHTGQKMAFANSSGSIYKQFTAYKGSSSARKYTLEAWVLSSNGNMATLRLDAINNTQNFSTASSIAKSGWQLVKVKIKLDGSQTQKTVTATVSCNGGVYVDDIRFYPQDADISTFTYDPLTLKLTSMTDVNNVTSYYEYDGAGRLHLTRDLDGNITSRIKYNYKRK